MNAPGYEQLAAVLQAAFDQASAGKGAERHANDLPFHEQRMLSISALLDTDAGMAHQACKKIAEARGMAHDARERELLGAIVYIAGMVIFHRQRNGATFGSLLKTLDADQLDARSLFLGGQAGRDFVPAGDFDEQRADIIGQNGNDGLHYEPERPRHLCQTCAQGHATHQCTAGNDPLPLAELAIQQGGKPLEEAPPAPAEIKPAAKPELPPTDHLVDPTGKPQWKDAPHWACYLTQDENGVWKWWHKKPAVMGSRWQGVGMFAEVNSGEVIGRWQDKFECAPGLTVGAEA